MAVVVVAVVVGGCGGVRDPEAERQVVFMRFFLICYNQATKSAHKQYLRVLGGWFRVKLVSPKRCVHESWITRFRGDCCLEFYGSVSIAVVVLYVSTCTVTPTTC